MSTSRPGRKKPEQTYSDGVRPLLLDAAGLTLSGLLAEPPGPPRAAVLAVHGGGMRAGYFDGQAQAELSLLTLGAQLGFTVLAIDRPGYGESVAQVPDGLTLEEQSDVLSGVLDAYAERYDVGRGFLLLAHSYGGKLALTAAGRIPGLLGLDASGVGQHYGALPSGGQRLRRHMEWERNWGPLGLYPAGTFRAAESLVAPIPVREAAEAPMWPEMFEQLAPRIDIPLRLTFAEHETWWRHEEPDIADLVSRLAKAPVVRVERQPDAGHNISLGWAARCYHLRAFAFFEECLRSAVETAKPDKSSPEDGQRAL
jgi:pimeloyl-ACP methyl ester carboxylesterase